jgi:hypothetical protein
MSPNEMRSFWPIERWRNHPMGERFMALAHIIHDGSRRNRQDATRDGHAESRAAEAYSRSTLRPAWGEPARLAADILQPSLSQRRIGGCSRSVHE